MVKIITKSAGDKYYNQKGIVRGLVGKYAAIVKLLNCGTKIKLDQDHLQTCIPSVGKLKEFFIRHFY